MKYPVLMISVIGGLLRNFTSVACSAASLDDYCYNSITQRAEHKSFIYGLQQPKHQNFTFMVVNSTHIKSPNCMICHMQTMELQQTTLSPIYTKGIFLICSVLSNWIPSITFQKHDNISFVSLSRNQLKFLRENDFQPLPNLTHLDLSHNRLKKLHSSTFKLPKLQSLLLNNNWLADLNDDIFIELTDLKYLNLSENQLHNISPSLFRSQGNLLHLSLECNRITSLSNSLFALQSLEYFELSGNPLEIRVEIFLSLQKLKAITIPSNRSQECNCEHKAFWDWSQERNLNLSGSMVCLRSGEVIPWSDIQNCKKYIANNLSLVLFAVPIIVALMICIALFYHYFYKPLQLKQKPNENCAEATEVTTYSVDNEREGFTH